MAKRKKTETKKRMSKRASKSEDDERPVSSMVVEDINKGPTPPDDDEEIDDVFEADGKRYKLTAAKFQLDGIIYDKKDALKNKSVLAKLVEMKSSLITEA